MEDIYELKPGVSEVDEARQYLQVFLKTYKNNNLFTNYDHNEHIRLIIKQRLNEFAEENSFLAYLLSLVYVHGQTLKTIISENKQFKYSYRHIKRLHSEALKLFAKYIKITDFDKNPPIIYKISCPLNSKKGTTFKKN